MVTGDVVTVAELIRASREHESAGDIGAAMRHATKALHLARHCGDSAAVAAACVALATAHYRLGRYDTAQSLLDQALVTADPQSPERAEALLVAGICAGETDDLPGAEAYFREAIDLSRQVGADEVLVRGLHVLSSVVYVPRGEFELALAADGEALKLAQDRDLQALSWGPVLTMCWVCWLTGQRESMGSLLEELRRQALPGTLAEGYWCFIRAGLAMEAGAFEEARRFLAMIRSAAEASGIAEQGFLARLGMSRLARLSGDPPSALTWAVDTLSLIERTGYRHFQGMALIERGRANWALGRLSEAKGDLRSAGAILAQLEARFDLVRSQLLLAALLYAEGSAEADAAWAEATTGIVEGGYAFLLEQERGLAFPLLAAHLDAGSPETRATAAALMARLAQVAPAPLRIVALGEFEVHQGGRRIPERAWITRRAGELFRLLLISPSRRLTRDQAVEALWPGKRPQAAAAQLHQATSALRRALEPDLPSRFPSRYLVFEEGIVGLRLPSGSWIDSEAFVALLEQHRLAEAVALWRGDLFAGDLYADWATGPREDLRARYLLALLTLARERVEAHDAEGALALCQRILEQEPWHEAATLLGMQACVALGDRVSAIRLYRLLEQALHDELSIEPQPAVRTLYRSLVS